MTIQKYKIQINLFSWSQLMYEKKNKRKKLKTNEILYLQTNFQGFS